MSRVYDLVHRTSYEYDAVVTDSYGATALTPRDLPDQRLVSTTLEIDPAPADSDAHTDYFGNSARWFAITTDHRRLVVTARSTVEVTRAAPELAALPATGWEAVAAAVRAGDAAVLGTDPSGLVGLLEMVLPSRHVRPGAEVLAWSAPTFAPGRPLVEVVAELAHRIRAELAYRTGATTVTTTQAQLLDQRAGVCQDFAHLAIAALRAHGLPARYTSGYLETRPQPGRPKLRGADASHAWLSAWVPGYGWLEIDPTNDKLVDDRYVVLGWGRDYDDVPPLRGVIETEGSPARPQVAVDLVPAGTDPFV